MRLRRVETVQTQTPSLPSGRVIICAVLAALPAVPPPYSHAEAGRFAAGAQIITGADREADAIVAIRPYASTSEQQKGAVV
jgi:hypothetical protein